MWKRRLYSININDSLIKTHSILWEGERVIKFSAGCPIFAKSKYHLVGLLKMKILYLLNIITYILSSMHLPGIVLVTFVHYNAESFFFF